MGKHQQEQEAKRPLAPWQKQERRVLAKPEGAWSSGRGAPGGARATECIPGGSRRKTTPSLLLPSHLLPVSLAVEPEVPGAWQCCAENQ